MGSRAGSSPKSKGKSSMSPSSCSGSGEFLVGLLLARGSKALSVKGLLK